MSLYAGQASAIFRWSFESSAPVDEFKTAAASQKEAELHSPPKGANCESMLKLCKNQSIIIRLMPLSQYNFLRVA
ncbi:MAG: hypothetical protein WA154_11715 [Moraxellaceae bacterium]